MQKSISYREVVDRITGDIVFVVGEPYLVAYEGLHCRILRRCRVDIQAYGHGKRGRSELGWHEENRLADFWSVETRKLEELEPITAL